MGCTPAYFINLLQWVLKGMGYTLGYSVYDTLDSNKYILLKWQSIKFIFCFNREHFNFLYRPGKTFCISLLYALFFYIFVKIELINTFIKHIELL